MHEGRLCLSELLLLSPAQAALAIASARTARSALALCQAAGPCSLLSVGPCLMHSGSTASAGLCLLRSDSSPSAGPRLLRSGLTRILCATRCLLSPSTLPHHVIPQSGRSSLRPPDSGSHRRYHAQLLLSCQSLPSCQALESSCDPLACHAFPCADSLYQSSPQSVRSCGESCQLPAL